MPKKKSCKRKERLNFLEILVQKVLISQLLAESFSELGKVKFVFLQPHKNNKLTVMKEQNLYGNAIFLLAKNGTLYLQYLPDKPLSASEKLPVEQQGYNQEKGVILQQEATAIVKKLRVGSRVSVVLVVIVF